jgi:hypothetical protein
VDRALAGEGGLTPAGRGAGEPTTHAHASATVQTLVDGRRSDMSPLRPVLPVSLIRAGAFGLWLPPGGSPAAAHEENRRPPYAPRPLVRKDVRDLTDEEVTIYREVVQCLKDREPRLKVLPDKEGMEKLNRRSYTYPALLHTNYCPHGNWWFLPWHRAYLHYHEQMLQGAVREKYPPEKLPTVPYWDWTAVRDLPDLPLRQHFSPRRMFPCAAYEQRLR